MDKEKALEALRSIEKDMNEKTDEELFNFLYEKSESFRELVERAKSV